MTGAAGIEARALVAFHDGAPAGAKASPLWTAVEDNHRHNRLLWDEEDLARRRNVPDTEIAKNKRAIDAYNQKRNDAIERIDEQLLISFSAAGNDSGSRLSSETPGANVNVTRSPVTSIFCACATTML